MAITPSSTSFKVQVARYRPAGVQAKAEAEACDADEAHSGTIRESQSTLKRTKPPSEKIIHPGIISTPTAIKRKRKWKGKSTDNTRTPRDVEEPGEEEEPEPAPTVVRGAVAEAAPAKLGLDLGQEQRLREGEGLGRYDAGEHASNIPYVDDTAIIVDYGGPAGEPDGEVVLIDNDDAGVVGVVIEGNPKIKISMRAALGRTGIRGGGLQSDAPFLSSHPREEEEGHGVEDEETAKAWTVRVNGMTLLGFIFRAVINGDVDPNPNASDDEEDSGDSDDGFGNRPRRQATARQILQSSSTEDHDHESERMDVDDVDDGDGTVVRVKKVKRERDGDDDGGSRSVDGLEEERFLEVRDGGGGAGVGANDHADELLDHGREVGGVDQNQRHGGIVHNGRVDDCACAEGQANSRSDDERAETPAAGVDESTVDNGDVDRTHDEEADDQPLRALQHEVEREVELWTYGNGPVVEGDNERNGAGDTPAEDWVEGPWKTTTA
ncbi:hypothetical protein GALMADRAFT_216621 [Galerina marginata CBS 339.88]|uniref:Uncharacterized protein n=1 Tax=Galerina marginata (strain CBS 339.88) TaxID=685588 RepID=A0A067SAW9_GALM3|nr:hypothetical protein GALMADRAFT_216621 [Galerina marginata CBS 339.88]